MVNEIAAGDAVHPLAQAGVELPQPKEPIVADAEGIKGMDSAQQPTLFCGACVCRSAWLTLCSARGFRVPHCHVVPAFWYGWPKKTTFLILSPPGPSVDRQSPAFPVRRTYSSDIKAAPCSERGDESDRTLQRRVQDIDILFARDAEDVFDSFVLKTFDKTVWKLSFCAPRPPSVSDSFTPVSLRGEPGVAHFEIAALVHQRRSATRNQIPSTRPNGHAP